MIQQGRGRWRVRLILDTMDNDVANIVGREYRRSVPCRDPFTVQTSDTAPV